MVASQPLALSLRQPVSRLATERNGHGGANYATPLATQNANGRKYPAVLCLGRAWTTRGSVEIRRLCSTWNAGAGPDHCQVNRPVAGDGRDCDLVSVLTEVPPLYLSIPRFPWMSVRAVLDWTGQ